jgi:hypothetical protein
VDILEGKMITDYESLQESKAKLERILAEMRTLSGLLPHLPPLQKTSGTTVATGSKRRSTSRSTSRPSLPTAPARNAPKSSTQNIFFRMKTGKTRFFRCLPFLPGVGATRLEPTPA